ncbi:MAG: hypothetical protein ACRYG8_01185 [Janthinobacterium lividum]
MSSRELCRSNDAKKIEALHPGGAPEELAFDPLVLPTGDLPGFVRSDPAGDDPS